MTKTIKLISMALTLLIAGGCARNADGLRMTPKEAAAMEFLNTYMSSADKGDYSQQYFLDNVRVTLKARKEMSWGKTVPDQLFRHFVLPLRVNNERLDDFRTMYYDTLKARVAGLSMHDAALEVNHWCHEKVTYTPSDARTSSPLASIMTGLGRCGEESTFTVAAMRAVGIPARQVYTPRWAHTDDNHAWVEVWTDGKWSFLGACEPEAELNMAWFNEPAARALLMHTLVYGDYHGPEDVIRRTKTFTEINVVSNYVKTRNNIVTVLDRDGNPVEGARVEFCIYNYGEFYKAVTLTSDAEGKATLHTGYGDMLVWASKDGISGYSLLSGEEDVCNASVRLERTDTDLIECEFDINPPAPGRIPAEASAEAIALNKIRLAQEDSIRNAYTSTFCDRARAEEKLAATGLPRLCTDGKLTVAGEAAAEQLVASRGNWRDILGFVSYAAGKDDASLKNALSILENISRKDVRDTREAVLRDFLDTAPTLAGGYPESLYDEWVLCPRAGGEFLQPYHKAIREGLSGAVGENPKAEDVIAWAKDNIEINEDINPRRLQATPEGTLRMGKTDSRSWDIFTVAALRSFGIPARVNTMTNKSQYVSRETGEWINIRSEEAGQGKATPKGTFTMLYTPGSGTMDNPEYYRHFSISRIEDGVRYLLEFEEGDATELGADASARYFSKPFTLDAGSYLLVCGSRMASGKVLCRMVSFNVEEGKNTDVELIMRKAEEDVSVIGTMDAEKKYLPVGENAAETSILSTTGRGYFLLAVVGTGDEPTNHALRDLAGMQETFGKWGRPIVLLSPTAVDAAGLRMPDTDGGKYLAATASFGIDVDGSVRKMLCDGCHSKSMTLPVVTICDSFGRIVYLSTGYNTSLGIQLKNVIDKL